MEREENGGRMREHMPNKCNIFKKHISGSVGVINIILRLLCV